MKKLLLSVAILIVATYWLTQDNSSNDVKGDDFAELVNNTETVSLN